MSPPVSVWLSAGFPDTINEDQLRGPNETFLKRQIIYDRNRWICTVFIRHKNTVVVV